MRVAQLAPGSGGGFYCENCLRDADLIKAMRKIGVDVVMLPMYLPMCIGAEEPASGGPMFFGGINVYLQQKMGIFRKTPGWIDRLFDGRGLLRVLGRKASMTSAKELGEMTISMLRGRDGRQVKELEKLIEWLEKEENRPDVVCLSNALLAGLAGPIRQRLGAAVVCLLQDEDGFIDGLGKPYAEQAWGLVSRCAKDVDVFVAVSEYYADVMRRRMGLGDEKVRVVYTGIPLDGYGDEATKAQVPTIGYLSRMCYDKGLDVLAEAFILLKKKDGLKDARLRIAGGQTSDDREFINGVRNKLARAGLGDDVEFAGGFDRESRISFLEGLWALCVPSRKATAYGLYVLEAMAAGTAVVEPAIGVFGELLEATGGGVLFEPNTVEALADALGGLLGDFDNVRRLGAKGKAAVCEKFNVERTAKEMMSIYEEVAGKSAV